MPKKDNSYIAYYKNKNILITGGSGYMGSSIINALSPVSCKITVLDIRRDNALKPIKGQAADISLKQGDIKNKSAWLKSLKGIDIVFHFAAQTSSHFANEKPVNDMEINLLPAVNLIETCHKNKLRPDIIFAGTVTEAGLTDKLPVDENFKDNPVTVYDINKLAAEKYFQYYSNQMAGGRSVTLRLSNVYGPGPASSSADRGVLNKMICKALKEEALTIYGDGGFVRDYIYIDDVVKAFLTAGANMDKVKGKYFVVGSCIGHSIKDMVNIVKDETARRTGKKALVNHVPPPSDLSVIEFRNFIADSSAFTKATGWKAEVSLREGINKVIDFFYGEIKA